MKTAVIAACVLLSTPAMAGLKVGDVNGRPIQGATVTILIESKNLATAVFGEQPVVDATDERGTLPFEVPRFAGAMVVVDHEDFAPAILALDGTRSPSSITLHRGATLSGHITGDGHAPLGLGKVCAIQIVTTLQNAHTFDVKRCGTVAGDGTWTLSALPSGTVRLEIGVPEYLPLATAVSLPAEKWIGGLESGLRAFLHVEDAAGRPAPRATIECDGAVPTTTDSDGNARIAVPTSGSKCRAFAADGAMSPEFAVQAPSTVLQTLRLKRARSATATLVTNDASDPSAPRFTLLEKIGSIGERATSVEPVSSRDGTFRIPLPEEGSHALRVEASGLLPLTTEWFSLPPGGGTADLGILVLRRGAGIRGQILHASTQAPLAGAVVSLEAQGRARIVLGRLGKAQTVTDSDGSFTVAGVAIGSYRMRVAWRDLPPLETAIDLRDESVLALGTIALHPGVRISGNVHRNDHAPWIGARVELVSSRLFDGEPIATGSTAADGSFGPITIAPGSYRLLVRGDDLLADQEIEVPSDEDSIDVDVRIRSTRVTGIIRDAGVPVSGGEVLLRKAARGDLGVAVAKNPRSEKQFWSGKSDSHFGGTVNGAGVFTVDDVPAGRMVLEYFGRSGERVTRAVDVSDDAEASIAIDIDGWRLQGRVDDVETETGLEGKVEVVDGEGTVFFHGSTRFSGDFSIDRLPPGRYNVVASADGYRTSDPVQLVIGNEAPPPLRVRLSRAADATLDLVVKRDPDTPAAGVAVAIVDAVGRQLRAFPTLANGRLHATGLSAGTIHIIWSDPLAGVGMSAPIQLRSGPQDASVVLEPGKDLIVHCEAAECSGARLGSLAFTNEHGIDLAPFLHRMRAVVYSDRGAAYLGRLAPGSYDVAANSGAFRLTQHLELGSGPGEVDLVLKRR